jgi:hypothetical protein
LVLLLLTKPVQKKSEKQSTNQVSTASVELRCEGASCSGIFGGLNTMTPDASKKTDNADSRNSGSNNSNPSPSPSPSPDPVPDPVPPPPPTAPAKVSFNRNVFLLIYDPTIPSHGGQKLSQVMGWNDPEVLTSQLIDTFTFVSGGQVHYSIAQRMVADRFVTYTDGYTYDGDTFVNIWNNGKNFNHGDAGKGTPMMDYPKMLSDFGVCDKLNSGQIDELWVWAYPYSGMWESNMTGPGAYWLNSSPTTGTSCNKLLPIMGWNHERGVAEALHSYGHRVESIMTHVYGSWSRNDATPWNKFTTRNRDISGKAQCGDVHFPPNANSDYDYSNSSIVMSACDDFLTFPTLSGNFKSISCSAWGCSHEGYMRWWLSHLPKANNEGNDGKSNDWWNYIVFGGLG